MMPNTTTTTARKVEKGLKSPPAKPRVKKPYTRVELAAEVLRLTGEEHDPQYLAELSNGTRRNRRLKDSVRKAVANLVRLHKSRN